MVRGAIVLALLAACGRVNFDEMADAADAAVVGAHSWLIFDRVAPGQTFNAFAVPVVLDDTRARRDLMRPDAFDVRFHAMDGTLLPHEIEQLGAPGAAPLVAWVEVPRIAGLTTQISVEYGDDQIVEAPRPWSGYEAVWHMGGTGTVVDSTPNGHHGTATGTASTPAVVASGRALAITASDCIVVRSKLTALTTFTLSAWMRFHGGFKGSTYASLLTRQYMMTNGDDLNLGINGTTTQAQAFGGLTTSPGGGTGISGGMLTTDHWIHEALVYDGSVERVYVDGVQVAAMAHTGTPVDTNNVLFMGCGHNGPNGPFDVPDSDYLDGELDEIRIERSPRTARSLVYDVAAMRDQVITYGPVEPGVL